MSTTAPISSDPRTAAPAGSKLRDSCQNCALSKLKCSKEKPVCDRCARRGLVCEYFATKRAGRKHGSRRKNPFPPSLIHNLPAPTSGRMALAAGSSEILTTPTAMSLPPIPPAGRPEMFTVDHSPAETTPSTPASVGIRFDDFLAYPESFPFLDLPDVNSMVDPYLLNETNDNNFIDIGNRITFPPSHDISSPSTEKNQASSDHPLPFLNRPQGLLNSPTQTMKDTNSGSVGCCLMRALDLLRNLMSSLSTPCPVSGEQTFDSNHRRGHHPSTQSLISENEKVVQAVNDMLQCSCSHDQYLIAIASIIMFRVLDRYAAIVKQTHNRDEDSQSWDAAQSDSCQLTFSEHEQRPSTSKPCNYYIEGEDQGRMAAQQVLSELHRVQRLLNILPQRFKAHGMQAETAGLSSNVSQSSLSLPTSTLDHIEVDLRKCLRNLSAEIVNILRQR